MEREYKDSGIEWIGRIPKEWEVVQLKRFLSFKNGQDYKDIESNESDGYPVFGSGGIFAYAKKYLYDNESVLFGRKGTINRPLYVNCKFWTVDTMYYAIPSKNAICKYLYYTAITLPFDKYSTSTALPSMTQTVLGNLEIPFPPLPEQQRIADYLDSKCDEIDKLIELQDEMIKKLNEYKQSVITEAVTKGLNPNAKLVPSGIDWIGEVPEGWTSSAALKWFAIIILGKMLQSNANTTFDTLEKYICAKDVHFNGIDYSDLKSMYFSPIEKKNYQIKKGDLLVVEGGAGAAGAALVDDEIKNIYIQNSIMIVRSFGKINISYVKYFLFSIVGRGYVDYICNKATIPHFTKDKLSETLIPLPPLPEQHSIATFLDKKCSEIDSLISLKQQKIERLKEYKKSIIYEAVTGKKQVV